MPPGKRDEEFLALPLTFEHLRTGSQISLKDGSPFAKYASEKLGVKLGPLYGMVVDASNCERKVDTELDVHVGGMLPVTGDGVNHSFRYSGAQIRHSQLVIDGIAIQNKHKQAYIVDDENHQRAELLQKLRRNVRIMIKPGRTDQAESLMSVPNNHMIKQWADLHRGNPDYSFITDSTFQTDREFGDSVVMKTSIGTRLMKMIQEAIGKPEPITITVHARNHTHDPDAVLCNLTVHLLYPIVASKEETAQEAAWDAVSLMSGDAVHVSGKTIPGKANVQINKTQRFTMSSGESLF